MAIIKGVKMLVIILIEMIIINILLLENKGLLVKLKYYNGQLLPVTNY